jgi:hypothetical protein
MQSNQGYTGARPLAYKEDEMTKSQKVAQLMLRSSGCTSEDALTATGWSRISMPWHAKNNGLRLRKEINGRKVRYFAERRKIEVWNISKGVGS